MQPTVPLKPPSQLAHERLVAELEHLHAEFRPERHNVSEVGERIASVSDAYWAYEHAFGAETASGLARYAGAQREILRRNIGRKCDAYRAQIAAFERRLAELETALAE